MKKNFATNRGLIKMIVLIIAGLILLAYLGLNLRSIVESQTFVDNWEFIKGLAVTIWNNYLSTPIMYLWSKVFIPYLWEPIINNIAKR
jgi:hypothetical protein